LLLADLLRCRDVGPPPGGSGVLARVLTARHTGVWRGIGRAAPEARREQFMSRRLTAR
jgi:hypothetical protein